MLRGLGCQTPCQDAREGIKPKVAHVYHLKRIEDGPGLFFQRADVSLDLRYMVIVSDGLKTDVKFSKVTLEGFELSVHNDMATGNPC